MKPETTPEQPAKPQSPAYRKFYAGTTDPMAIACAVEREAWALLNPELADKEDGPKVLITTSELLGAAWVLAVCGNAILFRFADRKAWVRPDSIKQIALAEEEKT